MLDLGNSEKHFKNNDALQQDRLTPFDFTSFLRDGDALIIVPPFADWNHPSLAAHLLQACAREASIRVSVLYANIILASVIGTKNYKAICYRYDELIGEQLFAAAAYDVPPLSNRISQSAFRPEGWEKSDKEFDISWSELQQLETKVRLWIEDIAVAVARRNFKVVGCSTSFQQTSASVALLNCIKRMRPEVVTIIGGANCESEMAKGIASLDAQIDFIFSGESEVSFPNFLKQVLSGDLPSNRIIYGKPCMNLDAVPTPSYVEFFEQLKWYLPNSAIADDIWLLYESSRGCWWGQKHHCTFCGLNGMGMQFREKSPERVINELRKLVSESPSRRVCMVDNIMPYTYFQTLIPSLGTEVPNLYIHYEQKANLTLEKVIALKKAGVMQIQPGIEALSSSLLRRMKKGVSASQNIALLRYCRSVNMIVTWNLLYDLPGDQHQEYEQTLALLPLLRHLQPPTLCPLVIDRFSPYFDHAEDYGVNNIRPLEVYASVFPPCADITKLAYHFVADYRSDFRENPDTIHELKREIDAWRKSWFNGESQPILAVARLSSESFVLLDKRGLPGTQEIQFLNREEASVALVGGRFVRTAKVDWAIERKLGVELDGLYVPLATAEPELILEFEITALPSGLNQAAHRSGTSATI